MAKERLKNSKTLQCRIIFLVFFIYQLFQQSLVWLYHDDYGYASLHYGTDVGTTGMSYGLADIVEYLKWHYLNWGGRVLFYFIMIVLIRVGGLWLIRIVQAIIVTGIMYEMYLLVRRKGQDSAILAVTTVLLYGMFSIMAAKDAIYWYAASSAYTWPMLFFLLGILVQERILEVKNRGAYYFLTFLLFWIAGFSHEQVAVVVIVYVILDAAWKKYNAEKINWCSVAGAILGGAIEILAPGNFARSQDSTSAAMMTMSLGEKIRKNTLDIISCNFSGSNVFVCALVCAVLFMATALLHKRMKKSLKQRVLLILLGISVIYPIMNVADVLIGRAKFGMLLDVISVLWLIDVMVIMLWYALEFKEEKVFIILVAAVASQAMMVFAPAMNRRSATVAQYMLDIVALFVFWHFITRVERNGIERKIVAFAYLLYATVSIVNMTAIGYGYYQNNLIHAENDRRLRAASSQIKDGIPVESVVYYKAKYRWCTGDMPYNEGKEYIEYWMREYYELPQDVRFEYREYDGRQ